MQIKISRLRKSVRQAMENGEKVFYCDGGYFCKIKALKLLEKNCTANDDFVLNLVGNNWGDSK